MALYDYTCGNCGHKDEYLVPQEERNSKIIKCPKCQTSMNREMPVARLHGDAYYMQAVLPSGEHVKGHFGGDGLPEKWRRK